MSQEQKPQEPLVVSLEEAMVALLDAGMRFVYYGGDYWSVKEDVTGHYRGTGSNWWAAAAQALGRPVVARDDAAELRTALREWAEATQAAEWFELDQTNAYGTDHADAEDRLQAAVKALRALAATEGSE